MGFLVAGFEGEGEGWREEEGESLYLVRKGFCS